MARLRAMVVSHVSGLDRSGSKLPARRPRSHIHFLQHLLGLSPVANDTQAQGKKLWGGLVVEEPQRFLVAARGAGDQVGDRPVVAQAVLPSCHGRHLPQPRSRNNWPLHPTQACD
jgi:hypothetical protein